MLDFKRFCRHHLYLEEEHYFPMELLHRRFLKSLLLKSDNKLHLCILKKMWHALAGLGLH
jgi:hypothetical protein